MTDPLQQFRLDGRVAVVTGASSGMGVVFAETLTSAGARVVLAARREELLNAVAEGIRKRGGEALALRCDVAREDEIDALVAKTLAAFGSIDVLVNNAGFTMIVPAEDQALADWRAHVDVMLTGSFLCAQRFGRHWAVAALPLLARLLRSASPRCARRGAARSRRARATSFVSRRCSASWALAKFAKRPTPRRRAAKST